MTQWCMCAYFSYLQKVFSEVSAFSKKGYGIGMENVAKNWNSINKVKYYESPIKRYEKKRSKIKKLHLMLQ